MTKTPAGLLLSCLLMPATGGAEAPKPATCLIQPDKTAAVKAAEGRAVYCGLDLGSKTAKLSVVSLEPGKDATVRDERQCKRTLGMGALVFDSTTGTARALPDDAIGHLVDTIREYQKICTQDGGVVAAAGATQWARDATNIADVQARVKTETGLLFEVLSPEQEAEYGYVAASVNTPGRIVLDPGSNSFQIAWQETGSPGIRSVLIKYGYVRGAVNDIEPAADFAAGRAQYQAKARAQIEEELGKLTPPMSLARLRQLVAEKKIGPELVALGQDGAVHLSVRGLLRSGAGGWITEPDAYAEALRKQTLSVDPSFGILTADPLRPADVAAYLDGIAPSDFKLLTSEPARSLYGQKALVVPALVDLLFRELGVDRLVMVPQETTTGHILAKRPRSISR